MAHILPAGPPIPDPGPGAAGVPGSERDRVDLDAQAPRPPAGASGPAGRTGGHACRRAGGTGRRRAATPRRRRRRASPSSGAARPPGAAPRRRPGRAHPTRSASAAKGGSPEARRIATSSASTAVGSPSATAWSTGWSGTRVWTCTRAQGAPLPRRADQPGGPDEQRQGLLGGRQPRRQQVQIDVEEGHGSGAAHPVQHRLGADQHGGIGTGRLRPGRPRAGHLPHLGAEERRQLLAQPAHAGPQRLHAQPAAGRAHDRPGLVAARAAQHLLPARLRRRGAAAGTAGQLAAVTAGQQAGAAGAVVDADERAPLAAPRHRRGRTGPAGRTPRRTCRCAGRRRAGRPARGRASPPAPRGASERSVRSPARRGERHRRARATRGCRARPRAGPARPGRRPRCRWGRSPPGRPRRAHRGRRRPPAGAPGPRRRPGCRPRPATRPVPPPTCPRSGSPGAPAAP